MIFEHAWRQAIQRFYERTMHGVDWEAMRDNDSPFLASINNDYDLADLIAEMVGEINVSHMGCRFVHESR